MQMFVWGLLFFLGAVNPVWAQAVYKAHTHVQLVSEQNTVLPGKTFWGGINLD